MRRKHYPAIVRALAQVASNRFEWVKPVDFYEQELVILKEDGYYIPVKF